MKVLVKLSRGVLEIAAGDECRYAKPSFLQRAYLVWTFRNFRRLSVRVLNKRQREMVERLSHFAETCEPKRIDPAQVIGRAEFPTFPVRKALIVEPAASMVKVGHPVVGVRLSSAHRLSNLRVVVQQAAQQAAKTIATSSRGTRSRARYSLILTLTAASFIVISGAVAQRLWINRAKSTPSTTANAPSLKVIAQDAIRTAPATQPIPPSPTVSTKQAKPIPRMPLASTAMQPPIQEPAISVSASESQAVTAGHGPKPVESREPAPGVEARNEGSRLRVFLAPQSIIYPAIPVSAVSPDQKKQILVKAIVNTDGTVEDVQVPGQPPGIATAIAKTVKQWRYQPYLLNGQPVEVETRMIFTVLGPDALTVRFLPAGEDPAND